MNAVFLLPKQTLKLEVLESSEPARFTFDFSAGRATQTAPGRWAWKAPAKTGIYPLKIADPVTQSSMTLNAFVMVPYSKLKNGYLNGYRIGRYPILLRAVAMYRPPKGFIELTKANELTLISPHFRLRQFVCKQQGGYPKYLVLRERLILELESVLEEVNLRGIPCVTLGVMSGYRTPYYNRHITGARLSRHQWGDAADIYVDTNGDGRIADINHDGKTDYKDAAVLYSIIDVMQGMPFYSRFLGGLSHYMSSIWHGPFVHVDARGYKVRWGNFPDDDKAESGSE